MYFLRSLAFVAFFMDIVAAFDSLQRMFVFGYVITDAQALGIFARLGWKPDIFQDFLAQLQSPGAFQAGLQNARPA